jgi:transporter family protein
MFGILIALLSALSFGLSQTLVRRNIAKSNYVYISLTVTIIGNIILWPLALAFTDLSTINPDGLILFIIAGLLAPGIARLFFFKGMESAGMSANSSIFSTYPLYTSIIATLLLGEVLTAENWMGLICIIVGVIFVGRSVNNKDVKTRNTTKMGLIISFLGSLAIAFSQILRKEGLNIYNQPLLGVAVGYTMALIVYLLVIAFSRNNKAPRYSWKDVCHFWKPGVGIAVGWLLSFVALSTEMVSIIVPVLQTELLFIILFAYIFLRKQKEVTIKVAASAILIVAGVILVTIN